MGQNPIFVIEFFSSNTILADFEKRQTEPLRKESIFSVKKIANTLKPMIKNIVDKLDRSRVKITNRRMNGSFTSPNSSILKEKYLNDLVNEFEESKSRTNSKRVSLNESNNSNLLNQLSKSQNIKETEVKPKRSLKDMVSKAFNLSTNTNTKNVSKS